MRRVLSACWAGQARAALRPSSTESSIYRRPRRHGSGRARAALGARRKSFTISWAASSRIPT
eukprot:4790560-Prymnesium_polylepis.1